MASVGAGTVLPAELVEKLGGKPLHRFGWCHTQVDAVMLSKPLSDFCNHRVKIFMHLGEVHPCVFGVWHVLALRHLGTFV